MFPRLRIDQRAAADILAAVGPLPGVAYAASHVYPISAPAFLKTPRAEGERPAARFLLRDRRATGSRSHGALPGRAGEGARVGRARHAARHRLDARSNVRLGQSRLSAP